MRLINSLKIYLFCLFAFYVPSSFAFNVSSAPEVIVSDCLNNGITALREKAFGYAEEQLSCARDEASEFLANADFLAKAFSSITPEKLVDILHYYGLSKANLCKWSDAESAFIQAVNESKKLKGSYPRELPHLIQLVQLYIERGEYEKSLNYYDEIIKSGDAFFVKNDPIGYALVLEDQSFALEKSNKRDLAKVSKEKALRLRNEHPNAQPILVKDQNTYVTFPKECK